MLKSIGTAGMAALALASAAPAQNAAEDRAQVEDIVVTGRRSGVPLWTERSKARPLVNDLFASTPQEHLHCLEAAITVAEAGPAAIHARSDAWAARRVPEVIASPADKVNVHCWPTAEIVEPGAELAAEMKQLLAEPQVTVAVLTLRSLAEPGGVLDGLEAAGFDIQGPAWK